MDRKQKLLQALAVFISLAQLQSLQLGVSIFSIPKLPMGCTRSLFAFAAALSDSDTLGLTGFPSTAQT